MQQWKTSLVTAVSSIALVTSLTLPSGCSRATDSTPSRGPEAVAPVEPLNMGMPNEPLSIPVRRDPTAVVVRVDGQVLTQNAVDAEIDQYLAASPAPLSEEDKDQIRPKLEVRVVQGFVIKTLLKNDADRRNIAVVDGDVDEAIQAITSRLPAGETMDTMLQAQGMTLQELRDNLKGEVRIKKLIETQVLTNTVPGEAEIMAFYEQNKDEIVVPESVQARYLLIRTDLSDTAKMRGEKKTKAEELRKKAVEGADFAALAKANSDDEISRDNGGVRVFTRQDVELDPVLAEAAFTRGTNTIGAIVESPMGYHLIQVLEHTAEKAMELGEAKKQVAQFLEKMKKEKAIGAYLEELQSNAKIEYPGEDQAGGRVPAFPNLGKAGPGSGRSATPVAPVEPKPGIAPTPAPEVETTHPPVK